MSPFERFMLGWSAIATFVTGVVYAWMKYLMETDDPYAVVNHPWQPIVLKLHILVAPVLVFAVGVVFTQHIWKQWRSKRPAGRRTGLVTLGSFAAMVFSGYAIQVATHADVLLAFVVLHIVTGAAYFSLYVGHRALTRAAARRRDAEIARRLGTVDPADRAVG